MGQQHVRERAGRQDAGDAAPETDLQKAHQPASAGKSLGTLTPTNLVGPTARSLRRIKAKHGSVEGSVAGQMGWPPAQLNHYLTAERVDAFLSAARLARAVIPILAQSLEHGSRGRLFSVTVL